MIMVLMTAVCHCKYLLLLLHLLTLSIKVCFVNSGNFFLFSYRISGFFAASIRLNISSLVSWMRIILANWSKCVRVCVRDLLYSSLIDSCLNCVHRLQVFPDHQCVWSDLWVCFCCAACPAAFPSGRQWEEHVTTSSSIYCCYRNQYCLTHKHTHTCAQTHTFRRTSQLLYRYKDVYRRSCQTIKMILIWALSLVKNESIQI